MLTLLTLFLLFLWAGPAGEKWPLIQVPPQDTVARRGDAVQLDCSYRDASFTEWYFKDTGPLKNASRWVRRYDAWWRTRELAHLELASPNMSCLCLSSF